MAWVGGGEEFAGETGDCFPLGRGDAVEEEPCGQGVSCGYGGPAVTTAHHLSTMVWGEEEGEAET